MYLCVDTISQAAGVTHVGDQFATHHPLDPHHASESILKVIDKLLQEKDATVADLQGIYAIKGPGSFTGLRVGLSVANQFAHQLKIPIVGLRTDEWWLKRTDEPNAVYLQTMNREELYVAYGQKSTIVSLKELDKTIESICPLLGKAGVADGPVPPKNDKIWLGQLSDDHRQKLPDSFKEIKKLRSIEKTWQIIASAYSLQLKTHSLLVEPYYGKAPMITKSTKKLGL
jgi:tRNA threonylcarbamoyl adenosine modification protein YeaZ